MVEYGETLREIRKQKGITLKELAEGICSISFISKFERGDSDITLGLMTQILEKLMISFDEFLYIHQDFQPSKLEQFFKSVNTAYMNRNTKQLTELKNEEIKKWKRYGVETYHWNAMLIQVLGQILDTQFTQKDLKEDNIRLLSDYLFRVEVWGYYELALYNGTLLLLEPDMVIMLSRTAYQKSGRFKDYNKGNEAITAVLFNTIIYLLGPVNRFHEKFIYQKEIGEFITYLENLALSEDSLLERVHLLQLKGVYELRTGNKEEGIVKVNHAIQILKDLRSTKAANNMEKYLKLILFYQENPQL